MARLPKVGGDKGNWGDILNDFLKQAHAEDGTLATNTVGAAQLKPQSVSEGALASGSVTGGKLADGAVGTTQLADGSVTQSKVAGAGQADGIATLDQDGRLPETQVPTRLGESELSDTIGGQADTARRSTLPVMGIAFIADSIGMFNSNTGEAWHRIMCSLSDGRMAWRGVFGMGGYTLAQIRDTYLPQALALRPLPGCIVICGGTNDLAVDSAWQTLREIIALIEEAGVKPGLWSLPPRNDTPSVNTAVQRWNARLRLLAGTLNYPLFDSHSVLVDPGTGLYRTGWNQDAVHPNNIGHYQMGKTFASDSRLMQHFLSPGIYLSASKGADPNLIPANARFFDAGVNGNGAPNNWTTSGFPVAAGGQIIGDDAVPGNWFRFVKTSGTHSSGEALVRFQITVGDSVLPGERVAFATRFKVHAREDGSAGRLWCRFFFRDAGGATVPGGTVAFTGGGDDTEGIAYSDAVVPAGASLVRFEMTFNGPSPAGETEWAQVAQPTVLNLSRLI